MEISIYAVPQKFLYIWWNVCVLVYALCFVSVALDLD